MANLLYKFTRNKVSLKADGILLGYATVLDLKEPGGYISHFEIKRECRGRVLVPNYLKRHYPFLKDMVAVLYLCMWRLVM